MNKVCFYIPQILIIIALLFAYTFNISIPLDKFIEFKTQNFVYLDIAIFLFLCLNTIQLVFYQSFKNSTFIEKCLYFSMAMFICSLVFLSQLSLQLLVLITIIALIIAFIKKQSYNLFNKPLVYLFFAYFIWHAISIFWTNSIPNAKFELSIYSLFLVLPLCFSLIKLEQKTIDMLLLFFFRFMQLYILVALLSWLLSTNCLNINLSEWLVTSKSYVGNTGVPVYEYVFGFSNYIHPTFNGFLYVFALVIAGYYYVNKRMPNTVNLAEFIIYLASSFIIVIITQSRLSLLLWLFAVTASIIYIIRNNKKLLSVFIVLIVLLSGLVISFGWNYIIGFITDPVREQNFTTAIYAIEQEGLLGTGVGGMRYYLNSDQIALDLGYNYANILFANPHYQFLGDLMQTGIVGMLLCICLVIYLFYIAIKNKNYLMLAFMSMFFLLMQTEMPLNLVKGIMFLLVFVFLLNKKSDSIQNRAV